MTFARLRFCEPDFNSSEHRAKMFGGSIPEIRAYLYHSMEQH